METEISQRNKLPDFEERREILARAGFILAEARDLLQRLEHQEDRVLGPPGAETDALPRFTEFA